MSAAEYFAANPYALTCLRSTLTGFDTSAWHFAGSVLGALESLGLVVVIDGVVHATESGRLAAK